MDVASENNYFGFTKQTAMILEGLGIGNFIPQFKQKNISTQALPQLSKEDFITLGIDEKKADIIIKQLSSQIYKHKLKIFNIEDKSQQFIDVIKNGKQHLSLIQAFVTYTRLRLSQTSTDYIIDSNKNIRASEALYTVANCAIEEINNFQRNLEEMSAYICEDGAKKRSKIQIFSFISITLSACLIITWKSMIGTMKNTL